MVARIKGFVTRAEAGLAAPRSVSRNITPEKGGAAIHYGGPRQGGAEPGDSHDKCVRTWKGWQNFHMNEPSRRWVDIAYTGGVCNHGYAFAGRGLGVRTAGQGTNEGNNNFYAFVWIGGDGQKPTKDALDALDWWLVQARKSGAGSATKPHRWFKSTSCPGDTTGLVSFANSRDGKSVPTDTAPKPPVTSDAQVRKIQELLGVKVDGDWGPITDKRAQLMRTAARAKVGWPQNLRLSFDVRAVQAVIGTKVDGDWRRLSQAAMVAWVKKFQTALGTASDGDWGPKSDAAFLTVRKKFLNNY